MVGRHPIERWVLAILLTISACVPTTTTTSTTTTTTSSTTTSTVPTTTTTTLPADTTPPATPGGVSAAAAACTQVNLAWSASSDAGGSGLWGYNVYRNGGFVKQVMAPATSTSDPGLGASSVYSYVVAAFDHAGNVSGQSTAATTNTPACPDTTRPSIPSGLSATATTCSQVNLAWNASTDTGGSGLKGYNLYRNGAFLRQVLAPSTSTSDTGLVASTAYSYTAMAVDNAGNQSAAGTAAGVSTPVCASLDLVGFVPGVGTPSDVVVDATTSLAYVASREFGLSVVNVSNPSAPVAIGAANPAFYGQRVAVSGTLAAVSAGSLGMQIVDLTSTTTPRTVGTLNANVSAVALAGQNAYALLLVPGNPSHVDLAVVSLAVPSAPTIVGRITLGTSGSEIKVVGSIAYVAAGTTGVQIVNVANPTAPSLVGTVDTPGTASAIAVAGSYAYVADGSTVQVLNIATPSQPAIVGSLASAASALCVWGNRLYTVDGLLFRIVDVTTPAAPVLRSSSNSYGASRLDVGGTTAFLASSNITPTQGGLYAWNVTSPTAPTVLTTLYDAFDSRGVAVAGSLALAAGASRGMKVVDLTAPSAPRVASTLSGNFVGVALAGQTAYALLLVPGNPAHVDLQVINLSAPSAPTIVGRLTLGTGGTDIEVVGSLAYIAAGAGGLQIVSVASPNAPTLVGSVDTPGTASAVAVAGSYAYVADGTTVQVVRVSTPSNPTVVGSVAAAAWAIALSGNRLYAVDGLNLRIVDVTTPTTPVLLATTSGYGAQTIAASGMTVFLAAPTTHGDVNAGVRAVDLSSPTQPHAFQPLSVPGPARALTMAGGVLYAGDASSVVDVISVGP